MKRNLLFAFFVILTVSLQAQMETILENNPPRIKWNQINTKDFRLLFPVGFETQGQRIANTLQHIHDTEAHSLGSTPRKISVILQNQSSISNGFVSVLPRRSEFYTMSSQNYNFLGTNDWLDLLSSHEYRHVVQYQHALRGFNKVVYYAFGSTTFAALAQAAAPRWFWEGDAVATETAFTKSGRGRLPNFALAFKTNLLEGREFNYHKQYLRSYKHFIPDHYVLGYHMVSYLRQRTHDPEIWGKITAHAWNVPFIPFRFSSAIKMETDMYVTKLYREMARDLKQQWKSEIDQLRLTPFESITTRKSKAYTDYLYPQVMSDGRVVALKKGIGNIEEFVYVDNDKKIFKPGIYNETGMISSEGYSVIWNEFGYSPRWAVKNYSLIKTYNPATKTKKVIGGRRERYAGSAISPDGHKVATSRSDNNYTNRLVILDVETGKVLKEFANPENALVSMPRWSPDGRHIVFLNTLHNKRWVAKVDAATGVETIILPASEENVGYPVLYNEYLLFNSPVSGIDNIYAIDLKSMQRFQVTSSRYGAYNPAVSSDGKTLYYNDQTRDGMDVVKTSFDLSQWKPFTAQPEENPLVTNLVEQEGRPHLFDSIPQTKLPVTRYSRLKGIINPYSWGIYTDNTFAQAEFGIASKDILSTTAINLGLTYDINERTFSRKAAISYQGWFPILDLQYLAGNRSDHYGKVADNDVRFDWKEQTIEGGIRIPLTLTSSKYLSQFQIGDHIGVIQTRSFETTVTTDTTVIKTAGRVAPIYINTQDGFVLASVLFKDRLNDGDLVYNKFNVSYYALLKRSYRDFLYRWGLTLDYENYSALPSGDFQANQWNVRSTVYLPGLGRHHYLYGRFGYQHNMQGPDIDIYSFRNRLPKPRGHAYPSDETFVAFSANYALPLWYPDISIGPLLNIQRLRANLFYDYGIGRGRTFYYAGNKVYVGDFGDIKYQSVGAEATIDFNVMRFLPQFNVGVRATYKSANIYNNSGLVVEFLIGNIGF